MLKARDLVRLSNSAVSDNQYPSALVKQRHAKITRAKINAVSKVGPKVKRVLFEEFALFRPLLLSGSAAASRLPSGS
jgi:hypothetical protein